VKPTRSVLVRCLICTAPMLVVCAAFVALAPGAGATSVPRTVEVQVVPQYSGVQFTVDGVPGVTGPGGSATVDDPNLAGAAGGLSLAKQKLAQNLEVGLDRVATSPNHGVYSRKLVVELDVTALVRLQAVTPQNAILPISQVQSVVLTDSLGESRRLSSPQLRNPVWLPASRPAPVTNGGTTRGVAYSVKSLDIRGTNVVNSGQIRFNLSSSPPAGGPQAWKIPVLLHSLTITGNDLLGAKPAGKSVRLTYPNGSIRVVPLGPNHRVTLTDLPRGSYKVRVLGGVVPLASTVRLSRDQAATEIVVTTGDTAEILFIVLAVLAVLVAAGVIGRRRRRARTQGEGGVDAASV
jgi:LPXTG-motif cell wall-anchored protein